MPLSAYRLVDLLDLDSLEALAEYASTLPELPAIFREPAPPDAPTVALHLAAPSRRQVARLMTERRSALVAMR